MFVMLLMSEHHASLQSTQQKQGESMLTHKNKLVLKISIALGVVNFVCDFNQRNCHSGRCVKNHVMSNEHLLPQRSLENMNERGGNFLRLWITPCEMARKRPRLQCAAATQKKNNLQRKFLREVSGKRFVRLIRRKRHSRWKQDEVSVSAPARALCVVVVEPPLGLSAVCLAFKQNNHFVFNSINRDSAS